VLDYAPHLGSSYHPPPPTLLPPPSPEMCMGFTIQGCSMRDFLKGIPLRREDLTLFQDQLPLSWMLEEESSFCEGPCTLPLRPYFPHLPPPPSPTHSLAIPSLSPPSTLTSPFPPLPRFLHSGFFFFHRYPHDERG